jgi:2-dehydropantoate 2-reductase
LEALGEIGVHLSCAPTLQWAEWRKAAWNASMNAPLALAGLTNGALLEQPELHDTFIRLLNETVLIARAEGVDLDPNGQLQEQIESSIRATARNLNSMAAALAQGRPTEIDWINGAIVRRAAHHGISVPENQRLVNAVRARSLHGPR